MTVHKILIVDHQQQFIKLCQQWLQPPEFETQPVLGRADAEALLQAEHFDLALGTADGLDILPALPPEIPVIICTDREQLEVALIKEAIRLGAVTFLRQPEQADPLLETVRETLAYYGAGVRGNLRALSLTSLISILCNEGRQAVLDIHYNTDQATIFFDRGEVVHADMNGAAEIGEEVVFQALAWEEGQFALKIGQPSPDRTIHTSWTGLLLEGMQRIDETAFSQEQLEPEPDISWPTEFEEDTPLPPRREFTSELDSQTQTKIEEQLDDLYQNLVVRCLFFTDHTGRLLASQGQLERSRARSLSALVAGSFSAVVEMAELLAEETDTTRQFHQSLQEGPDFSLYSARVEPTWLLTVVFEPVTTNLGLVRQFTLKTAAELSDLLAQAQPATEEREAVADTMNATFREEVSNALGDLFS